MFVLVVDDDPIARMTHLALLTKIPEVTAIGAGSVAEARALIAETPPDVAIIDLQLPDGTGLEILAMLEQRGHAAAIIVVSAHLNDYKQVLADNSRLHKIGKPAPLRELTRLVRSALLATEVAAPFGVSDYMQLACMGHYSAALQCSFPGGSGEIVVVDGQLWSARDDLGAGSAAFNRLLTAKDNRVRVLNWPGAPPERNLTEHWEHLLLEAMRLADESRRSTAVAD